jgi:hypothetical protein
MEDSCPP